MCSPLRPRPSQLPQRKWSSSPTTWPIASSLCYTTGPTPTMEVFLTLSLSNSHTMFCKSATPAGTVAHPLLFTCNLMVFPPRVFRNEIFMPTRAIMLLQIGAIIQCQARRCRCLLHIGPQCLGLFQALIRECNSHLCLRFLRESSPTYFNLHAARFQQQNTIMIMGIHPAISPASALPPVPL